MKRMTCFFDTKLHLSNIQNQQPHPTNITTTILKQSSEKTYKLCQHAACNVAGLTADANILIDQARLRAGRYAYQYCEPIPVEQLVEHVCNYKQAYTQYGGLRPFGVAFLFAGYDDFNCYVWDTIYGKQVLPRGASPLAVRARRHSAAD